MRQFEKTGVRQMQQLRRATPTVIPAGPLGAVRTARIDNTARDSVPEF
ncbi:hypothetical protein SUDANB43_03777 [Streptomyces sp. enrichment culture]